MRPWQRRDPARSDPRLVGDVEAFQAIVREAAMRLGCAVEGYDGDVVQLWGHRLSGRVSLTDVRQVCLPRPRAEWRDIVIAHLDGLAHARERGVDYQDLPATLPALRSRLYPAASMSGANLVSRPIGTDLVEVLVVEQAGGIATVPSRVVGEWGRDAAQLLDLGRKQVQGSGLVNRRRIDLGDIDCTVLEDASFYTTSHVFWLPTYLDVPREGALVALPNRHLVMAHPIRDSSALPAVQALLVNARRLYAEGPGSLSARLWWWRAGRLSELAAEVRDDRATFCPSAEFAAVLESLPVAG